MKWLRPIVELAIETAMRAASCWRCNGGTSIWKAGSPSCPKPRTACPALSPKAVAILQAWPLNGEGRVFNITENAFKPAWQRAVKRAGLPDLHFHDLRHEAASRLAEKLTNILELSSVTGHRDLRMLERYYHPRPEELARKLAAGVTPPPGDRPIAPARCDSRSMAGLRIGLAGALAGQSHWNVPRAKSR